jgi:acetylornithine deacetylase
MTSTGLRLSPVDMLARLVSFDTETAKSNLPLIDFVEDYLKSWNVPYVRVPNAVGDKAAIYATIGPQVEGGVVLSGHTDVVPVAGRPGPPTPSRCAPRTDASMAAAPWT